MNRFTLSLLKRGYALNSVAYMATSTSNRKLSPDYYCIIKVKEGDYENYLATLLLPWHEVRRTAFAVRAFNVELSQIRDLTSNELGARMRFQFWSDMIDEMFDENSKEGRIYPGNQPVAGELLKNIKNTNGKLSKRHLKRLIDARSSPKNLSNFPFMYLKELEEYCDATICPVYLVIIEALIAWIKKDNSSKKEISHTLHLKLDHIANHVGNAQGIYNVLRGLVHNAKAGRCYIPSDLLAKHQASHEDFLRGNADKQQLRDVCFEMATIGHRHLELADSLIKSDKEVKPWLHLFLPTTPIERYLKKLENHDFNVFAAPLTTRDNNLPFRLWWKSIKLKYPLFSK